MPIQVIAGPAGSGKSQIIADERRPGDVLIDYTAIWAALTGAVRGPDGKYPERTDDDPAVPLVAAVQAFALAEAVKRQLNGYVTTSRRASVPVLERITGQPARIIDPGEAVIRTRLSVTDESGDTRVLSDECAKAMARWYG